MKATLTILVAMFFTLTAHAITPGVNFAVRVIDKKGYGACQGSTGCDMKVDSLYIKSNETEGSSLVFIGTTSAGYDLSFKISSRDVKKWDIDLLSLMSQLIDRKVELKADLDEGKSSSRHPVVLVISPGYGNFPK